MTSKEQVIREVRMQSSTFSIERTLTKGDRLNRFQSPRLRQVFTLFLVLNVIVTATPLVAQNGKKGGYRLEFGQVYGTAVFLNPDPSGHAMDAVTVVLAFTANDARRSLVLADKSGDYIGLLEPGHYCVSAYDRDGESIQLGDSQLKCVEVGAGKDIRLDVTLVSPKTLVH
jgi:hypothetical protein